MIDKNERQTKDKILWIDCAKAMAIIAVLVDHTYSVLYRNFNITILSYFSVSLFILLMGITTYISEAKHQNKYSGIELRRVNRILVPYIIATFIYTLVKNHFFDLNTFMLHLVYFNASDSFYFVLLYLQLIFVNTILYRTINRCNRISRGRLVLKGILGIVIIAISALTIQYSNILDIMVSFC